MSVSVPAAGLVGAHQPPPSSQRRRSVSTRRRYASAAEADSLAAPCPPAEPDELASVADNAPSDGGTAGARQAEAASPSRRVRRGTGAARLHVRSSAWSARGADEAGETHTEARGGRERVNGSVGATLPTTRSLLSREEELLLITRAQAGMALESASERLALELGRLPSQTELALSTGLSAEVVDERLAHGYQAKQLMVEHNLRLVYSIAGRFAGRGVELGDLVQEGAAGLVRGIERFDPSKGFKFSTYAHWWVRQAVSRSASEQSRTVRLPAHITEALARVRKAAVSLGGAAERPSPAALGEAAGMPAERVRRLLAASREVRSFDAEVAATGRRSGSRPTTLADLVAAASHHEDEEFDGQFLFADLNAVLNTLEPRERNVLRMHFGLAAAGAEGPDPVLPHTRLDVGMTYGITRERIRQIEDAALRKLRARERSSTLVRHLPQ